MITAHQNTANSVISLLGLLFLPSLASAHAGHDHAHWLSSTIHVLTVLAVLGVGVAFVGDSKEGARIATGKEGKKRVIRSPFSLWRSISLRNALQPLSIHNFPNFVQVLRTRIAVINVVRMPHTSMVSTG